MKKKSIGFFFPSDFLNGSPNGQQVKNGLPWRFVSLSRCSDIETDFYSIFFRDDSLLGFLSIRVVFLAFLD